MRGVLDRASGGAWHGGLALGSMLTFILVAAALLSFVWTPFPHAAMDIRNKLAPPDMTHWLGTDQFGRDVLSMMLVGARNSILVAVVAVVIGAGIGIPLGSTAAWRGGWVDELIMRMSDFAFAFPALLSAVMITAIFGPGAVNSIIAIGIFNIPVFARLTRGSSLPVLQRDMILAARLAGKGGARISIEHVLPNISAVLIVQATIQFALAILAEAGLSYLGLGTRPPEASWGRMLNEAQTLMVLAPHLAIFPGLAIVLSVLGLNLLGDGLRDMLDPALRHQGRM
ncbi:MAG: ABC transporter permease [Geminicoccaceae bacterium]|nr:ABC transporter permease [Geminicoccaceae bacterium]